MDLRPLAEFRATAPLVDREDLPLRRAVFFELLVEAVDFRALLLLLLLVLLFALAGDAKVPSWKAPKRETMISKAIAAVHFGACLFISQNLRMSFV